MIAIHFQVRDVLGVTSMVVGAALQRAPVDTVRPLQNIKNPKMNCFPPLTNDISVYTPIDHLR